MAGSMNLGPILGSLYEESYDFGSILGARKFWETLKYVPLWLLDGTWGYLTV